MRIHKFIALCGICSRREAERRILDGRVTVNGMPARIGDQVDEFRDVICMDGKIIVPEKGKKYVMLNKPKGYITSLHDEKGRRDITELLDKELIQTRLFPVGRLDYLSEGLLLMTNDGDISYKLTHPSFGIKKLYRVRVHGAKLTQCEEKRRLPVCYLGETYRAESVRILEDHGEAGILEISVAEGKNHEVRNI